LNRREGARCGGCGLNDASVIALLGLDDAPDPIAAATSEIEVGLVRRGLGRLHRLLRDDPAVVEAWEIKARVYQQLGFHDSAARAEPYVVHGPDGVV
jgi:predicted Zn-dependent protease